MSKGILSKSFLQIKRIKVRALVRRQVDQMKLLDDEMADLTCQDTMDLIFMTSSCHFSSVKVSSQGGTLASASGLKSTVKKPNAQGKFMEEEVRPYVWDLIAFKQRTYLQIQDLFNSGKCQRSNHFVDIDKVQTQINEFIFEEFYQVLFDISSKRVQMKMHRNDIILALFEFNFLKVVIQETLDNLSVKQTKLESIFLQMLAPSSPSQNVKLMDLEDCLSEEESNHVTKGTWVL